MADSGELLEANLRLVVALAASADTGQAGSCSGCTAG
jgi:hypothetical protein